MKPHTDETVYSPGSSGLAPFSSQPGMVLVAGCLLQSLSQPKTRGAGKTQESQAEVWTLLFVWGKMFATVTDMMKPSRQTET